MVEEFAFDNTEERRKTRQNGGSGWVEVIVGSMFSGKSEELIRRLRRAQIARQKVQVFKPKIDDRVLDLIMEVRSPWQNIAMSMTYSETNCISPKTHIL